MNTDIKKQEVNQITEGVIWKQLLIFFFPIVLGTFFQQLYNTVDTLIVGQEVGKNALASVGGSAAQITNLVVGFFTGLASGATVIIAQFYGAKNETSVRQNLHTAYVFSIIGGIIIGVIGVVFAPALLELMNTPAELLYDSTLYLRVYFAGLVFVFVYNMGSGILRATGDSKRPLYYLIICCCVNIVLDLIFVMQLHMGVLGVAIATFISQGVSAFLVTWRLYTFPGMLKLSPSEFRLYGDSLKSQLRIGLPTGIQSMMYSVSNVIIQTALNGFGTDTVAAWSVFGKLDAVFWMISGAFGISITTFVGQNYGAGKSDRIHKSVRICLTLDAVVSIVMAAFLLINRQFLFGFFTDDPEVIRIGSEMMSIITPCYVFFVFTEILSGALRGIGNVLVPMLISMGGTCILRIIWVFVCQHFATKVPAIISSYPVTWLLCGILFLIYYQRKKKTF